MTRRPLSDADILALLHLLDTEEPEGRRQVAGRLHELQASEPKRVETALAALPAEARQQAQRRIEDTRWERLDARLHELGAGGEDFDLEEGAWLLAATAYPGLRLEPLRAALDALAEETRRLARGLPGDLPPYTAVSSLLFEVKGFRGNADDYYDPENSYLNRVLERRLGIPVSLSCLYLFLGRRLRLPFQGVGLPGHFIVRYAGKQGPTFLDPYRGGRLLSLADCQEIARSHGSSFHRGMLEPLVPRYILARMTANLVHVYSRRGDRDRAARLSAWVRLLEPKGR